MMSFYSGLLGIAQDYSGLLGMRGPGYVWLRHATSACLAEKWKEQKWQKNDWQKDEKGTGTTELTADIRR
jgi:hypothetical protein